MAKLRGQMISYSPNRWRLRVFLGRAPDGKRRYSSRMFAGTTAQAQKELTALLRSLDTQTFVERSKMPLQAYLEAWIAGKIDVTPVTKESYGRQLMYFSPMPSLTQEGKDPVTHPFQIGHLRLTAVTPEVIQGVLNGMQTKGLSRRTMQYARAVLHEAFEDAIRGKHVIFNPTTNTKLPPKVKRPPSVLTMQQVNHFLEVTRTDGLYPLWRLLLTTGLRPQEAFALKWSDIDLAGKWLSVQRTLVDTGKGHYELVEATKTEGSTRRIGLPESTVEALKAHRKAQAAVILSAGTLYKRMDLVFASIGGRPLDISSVRRSWKASCKAAKLPIVRLYDTRHSHATALLAAGADVAWIKDRLGHSNVTTTIDNYAHVLPETHRAMGEMTERILKEAVQ